MACQTNTFWQAILLSRDLLQFALNQALPGPDARIHRPPEQCWETRYGFAVQFDFSDAARNSLGILDLDLIGRGMITETH